MGYKKLLFGGEFAVILQQLLGIPDTLGTNSATLSPSNLGDKIMVDATDRAFVGNNQFGMGYEPTYSGANSLFRRQYSREGVVRQSLTRPKGE